MITDLNQPAKLWLADALSNFGTLLDAGKDPSLAIELPGGVKLELRVNCVPGIYERHTISAPLQVQNPKG